MTKVPRPHKIFFAVICAAALLVAVLGYFVPATLAGIASWLELPPLHARFVGALYAYGAVFMVGCMLARYRAETRYALPMIAIWTGSLFVISIFNLSAFSFSRLPPWVWFASYLIYPLVALALIWDDRGRADGETPGDALPRWMWIFLLIQGVVVTILALLLLFAPGLMVEQWPWPITPLLAQTYGGPLLAYGLGSALYAIGATRISVRAVVPAMFVFALGVLVASFIHFGLFSPGDLADWLWFIAFLAATVLLGLITLHVVRASGDADDLGNP
jgi:hypothetical protein